MKIGTEQGGGRAVESDFGPLREGLRMAQRTTPTAIASQKARAAHRPEIDLTDIFAGADATGAPGPCSFHPGLAAPMQDQSQL